MKTKLPPLPIEVDELPKNGHSLKAYFVAHALSGLCTPTEIGLQWDPEHIVDQAYEIGDLLLQS